METLGPGLRADEHYYYAHGLGNDYLVFGRSEGQGGWRVSPSTIRKICRRGTGIGSDGLLVLADREPSNRVFEVRGFNPDGTEFERSGNGLRVLASHLLREGAVAEGPFEVEIGGSRISMTVHGADDVGRYDVEVAMGEARLGLEHVRANSDLLDEEGRVVHPSHGPIAFTPVSMGNPHAVVFPPARSEAALEELGPFLSRHGAFDEGINVQVVEVLGRDRIEIGIWERGVGRTSASGTSSCAAAVAGVATGRLQPGPISVLMEGGTLAVTVTAGLEVTLRGPVEEICEGRLTPGFVRSLNRAALLGRSEDDPRSGPS